MLLMRDLGKHINPKTAYRWKLYKSLFIMNKTGLTSEENITRITCVITCKHCKRVVRQLDVTIKTWTIYAYCIAKRVLNVQFKAAKALQTIS